MCSGNCKGVGRTSHELQRLAATIWQALTADEAAMLNRLALQVGHGEMAARLGVLARRVVRGDVDPPSATVWLRRQRPAYGGDP